MNVLTLTTVIVEANRRLMILDFPLNKAFKERMLTLERPHIVFTCFQTEIINYILSLWAHK